MNDESTPLRMRAFRVIDRRDGNYSKWIVIEDVERAQFRTDSHVSGSSPLRGMKAEIDKNDAWNVLNSFRNAARFPESDRLNWPAGDSIDAAISRMRSGCRNSWNGLVTGRRQAGSQRSLSLPIKEPNRQ